MKHQAKTKTRTQGGRKNPALAEQQREIAALKELRRENAVLKAKAFLNRLNPRLSKEKEEPFLRLLTQGHLNEDPDMVADLETLAKMEPRLPGMGRR